ncbi:hypothetical protein DB347_25030 [Opitutaceae bacterium EW11]|nr:hypothetical protein DB347_25030 [Opitutaceae bacterium EW11]
MVSFTHQELDGFGFGLYVMAKPTKPLALRGNHPAADRALGFVVEARKDDLLGDTPEEFRS